jgi:hypothetical protein
MCPIPSNSYQQQMGVKVPQCATAIMPNKSCIICKVEASPEVLLQYCDACNSALYCSKACQRKDWKNQHKQLCKLINHGHGDRQIRSVVHADTHTALREKYEVEERTLDEDGKRFLKLFEESTSFEGSQAVARKMKKIVKRMTKQNRESLLFFSLYLLVRTDPSEMLSWPNSPLPILLRFVNPNALSHGEQGETPLHYLVNLAAADGYFTQVNQLILAKQLIEHGANVNAEIIPHGSTPLHTACSAGTVTNLDLIELLLVKGADPNARDKLGVTPLMYTTSFAPGAARFVLNWPTTDLNIINQAGERFLASVKDTVQYLSNQSLDHPDHIQQQLMLQQWREVERMLVEKGAH